MFSRAWAFGSPTPATCWIASPTWCWASTGAAAPSFSPTTGNGSRPGWGRLTSPSRPSRRAPRPNRSPRKRSSPTTKPASGNRWKRAFSKRSNKSRPSAPKCIPPTSSPMARAYRPATPGSSPPKTRSTPSTPAGPNWKPSSSKIGGTGHRLWWPVLSCGLSLRSDALQQPCQKSPESPHRRNLQPLAGALHVHNMRTERNQLHARVLFADYAALQPRVHGYQFGNLAQNLLMHRLAFAHDIAGRFGLPPRIAAAVLHLKVRHPEDGGHHAAGSQFAALDGTALAGFDLHFAILRGHDGEVGGCLHQPGDVGAHRQNPMVLAGQQSHDRPAVGVIQHLLGPRHLFQRNAHARIEGAEFGLDHVFHAAGHHGQF